MCAFVHTRGGQQGSSPGDLGELNCGEIVALLERLVSGILGPVGQLALASIGLIGRNAHATGWAMGVHHEVIAATKAAAMPEKTATLDSCSPWIRHVATVTACIYVVCLYACMHVLAP